MEPRTSFLGRTGEIGEIADHVRSTQLVTLVGPGGVGKTRLAYRVADALADEATDGLYILELAPLATGSGDAAVADALVACLDAPTFEAAYERLNDASVLIVVDNCEHVIHQAIVLVEQLLNGRPETRILATSREPLDIPGELVVDVAPLPTDVAIELLRDRAKSSGATLSMPPDDHSLAELCDRLDGLPLALELAAPRLRSFSASDVVSGLEESADLLRRNRSTGDRHQSFRDTVAWSYRLLDADLAELFRYLSVFAGPFSLDDVVAIASEKFTRIEVADALDRLVSQSLLRAESGQGSVRYRMLVPVRQAARGWLTEAGEAAEITERLVNHMVRVAEEITAAALRNWSDDVVDEVFDRAASLRAAGDWCIANDEDPTRAFTMYIPQWGIVHHSHIESIDRHGKALLARWADPSLPLWGEVAAVVSTAALGLGDISRARDLANSSLEANAGPSLSGFIAKRTLSLCAAFDGDFSNAADTARLGAEWAHHLGMDSFGLHLDNHLANALLHQGELSEAAKILERTIERARPLGLAAVTAPALQMLAECHLANDPAEAERLLDQIPMVINHTELLDSQWASLRVRGQAETARGDLTSALRSLGEGLQAARSSGDRRDTWAAVRWIGVALALLDDDHQAEARQLIDVAAASRFTPHVGAHVERLLNAGEERVAQYRADPIAPAEALTLAARLCETAHQPPTNDTIESPANQARPSLSRSAAGIRVEWAGTSAQLPAMKGLNDLALLLAAPHREIHVLELMGSSVDEADTGPEIDATAKRQYEDRLRELHEQITEAEDRNDSARLELAQTEFDQIVDVLSASLGLGGEARSKGGSAEKARQAVSWRLRSALKKIDAALPGAGRHLRLSVKTGAFCCYDPEVDPGWVVDR